MTLKLFGLDTNLTVITKVNYTFIYIKKNKIIQN